MPAKFPGWRIADGIDGPHGTGFLFGMPVK